MSVTLDQIRRVPKVLLHDHLDGGLRPATIVELAPENGYRGLPTTDPAELGGMISAAAAAHARRRTRPRPPSDGHPPRRDRVPRAPGAPTRRLRDPALPHLRVHRAGDRALLPGPSADRGCAEVVCHYHRAEILRHVGNALPEPHPPPRLPHPSAHVPPASWSLVPLP